MAGTFADSVASLATAGTLYWGIRVYRRQVQDALVQQASKVFVTTQSGSSGVVIENKSDLPIFQVVVAVSGLPPTTAIYKKLSFDRLSNNTEDRYDIRN